MVNYETNFIKSILYSIICAIIVVKFDSAFIGKAETFGEFVPYILVLVPMMIITLLISISFNFLILKLVKIKGLKFKNIVDYFLYRYSFIGIIGSILYLTVYNISKNLIIAEIISNAFSVVFDMWMMNTYLNQFDLIKKKKYISLFFVFLYNLISYFI